ncbi:MAG: hypothetical protein ABJB47_16550 [Actinomycetota bacterium]
MPGHDDLNSPAGHGEVAEPSQRLSRRSVLRGAAGVGAAGVAATAFAGLAGPALASARPATRHEEAELSDEDAAEQIVVHVRDAKAGEIDLFRGTSHVRLHDRELAARLVRASR